MSCSNDVKYDGYNTVKMIILHIEGWCGLV